MSLVGLSNLISRVLTVKAQIKSKLHSFSVVADETSLSFSISMQISSKKPFQCVYVDVCAHAKNMSMNILLMLSNEMECFYALCASISH